MPDRYEHRLRTRAFDNLVVSVLGRLDLIRLKVLAAVDEGPRSRHMADVRSMGASPEERSDAVHWVLRTHRRDDPLVRDIAREFEMELDP